MKKRNLWVIALTFLLAAAWSNVYAATFNWTWLATENRAHDAHFENTSGYLEYFKMFALVEVDTTDTTTITGDGDPIETENLIYEESWSGPIYKQHQKTFADTSGTTPFADWENESFTFETTGPTYAYRNTTGIDFFQLGIASDLQTTPGYYPIITWSDIAGADSYVLRIMALDGEGNPTGAPLFNVYGVTSGYQYTGELFESGEPLSVIIEARDTQGSYGIANRSRYYGYHNPVPVPGAVWLLGSGLVGLVGFRRKYKK